MPSTEDIPRALKRFGHIEGSLSRHYNGAGAGLGLQLAKALMTMHGGTLDISSSLGKGTQVTLTLSRDRVVGPMSGHVSEKSVTA